MKDSHSATCDPDSSLLEHAEHALVGQSRCRAGGRIATNYHHSLLIIILTSCRIIRPSVPNLFIRYFMGLVDDFWVEVCVFTRASKFQVAILHPCPQARCILGCELRRPVN